jgi:hypothetical protein
MAASIFRKGQYNTVDALLDAFHGSAAEAEFDKYFGCFFNEESRFLGTDETENWTAREFMSYAALPFRNGKREGRPAWKYTMREGTRKYTFVENNTICSFDELLDSTMLYGGCRGSGVAVKDDQSNSWFLVQYHLSMPVPNDIALEVTRLTGEHNNLKQASAKSDSAADELLAMDEQVETAKSKSKSKGKKKK